MAFKQCRLQTHKPAQSCKVVGLSAAIFFLKKRIFATIPNANNRITLN